MPEVINHTDILRQTNDLTNDLTNAKVKHI